MFAKISFFTTVFMTVFVAASFENSCNTGTVHCCNNLYQATSSEMSGFLGLIGVVASGVIGQVGVDCTPITVVGAGGGAKCTQQPVCCDQQKFNGGLVIGCTPMVI